jgi:hypothetical protein
VHWGGLVNSFQTYGASDIESGIMGVSQSNCHISINQSQGGDLVTIGYRPAMKLEIY